MRIGQTSIIVFFAKILAAALGFIATVAFAQIVGAEVFGIYTLVLTLVGWASFISDVGIGGAITKRISENKEPRKFLTAGLLCTLGLVIIVSLIIIGARPLIESYVNNYNKYVDVSVVWFIIVLLFVRIFYTFSIVVLHAEKRVHIAGLLEPVRQGLQSVFQVGLVVFGFGLLGMFIGYLIGGILAGILGVYFVSLYFAKPSIHHFQSLFEYAKYSWLGNLKTRIFNEVDILVLAVFVPSSGIGIYAVAWSLSKFLGLFSNSISVTLFPEISFSSTQEAMEVVQGYVERALAYAGLIAIPGLIGGFLLSTELMLVYGSEFTVGGTVLWILILAVLIFAYQKQFVNALNGVDRPDLAFRVNIFFAVTNIGLNFVLIPQYGIEGAAIASVVSVTVALIAGYHYLSQLIKFTIPLREISRQVTAALFMGVVVFFGQKIIYIHDLIQQNIIIVLLLVGCGSFTYFLTLILISSEFRKTVDDNVPFDISLNFR